MKQRKSLEYQQIAADLKFSYGLFILVLVFVVWNFISFLQAV